MQWLAAGCDPDYIEETFQEEMEEDGYYEKVDDDG
jgi:hypothetical protein